MPDELQRSPEIPAPTREPITWQKQKITPAMILDLWRSGYANMEASRTKILEAREFRRMADATKVQISTKWSRLYPEAAFWIVETLEERMTLDRNMVARVGVTEPEFVVSPIATKDLDPFTQTAHDLAEAREAYLEEWRTSPYGPPTQAFFGKGTEDGQYARVSLPVSVDMEGCPTFFETLDERAYDSLSEDDKRSYVEDEDTPKRARRKRYVKVDDTGQKVVSAKYRGADVADEQEKHQEDVRRYLLDKQAASHRLIPALDCVPIFKRGSGRERWELLALVERTLYYVEELLEKAYAWTGMGDRQWVPLAYDADGTRRSVPAGDVGSNDQLYKYTVYLTVYDDDGHCRPIIAETIAGAGTTWGTNTTPTDPAEVHVIDLYEEWGLEGAYWSYHGGLHTEDDDPAHYWSPYITPLIPRMKSIEGNKTSINGASHVNSFGGQYYRPDATIAGLENADEFLLDSEGELRRPQVARAGELLPAVGEIFNAPPPQIGADAWRQLQADLQALAQQTAIDQIPGNGPSGAAMVVQTTIGQVAKRHIREGALDAVVRCGEDHLKILDAIYRKHDIRWPLQTVEERPVEDSTRRGVALAEYDPRWIGDGSFRLKAEYPEEENLARIDLELKLQQAGVGSTERVYKAMGEKDSDRARLNADKDRLMKHPAVDAMRLMRVAKKLGDKELQQIAQMQAKQLMAPADVPGMSGGIPTAATNRGAGSSVPSASDQRGGVEGGQMNAARAAANADAALTQTNPMPQGAAA